MLVKDILNFGGKLLNGNIDDTIENFSITLDENSFYIPLKNYNDVLENINKIKGLFVTKNNKNLVDSFILHNKNIIIIETNNNFKFMEGLARYRRAKLDIPVIALTGSYGKTSQRNMISNVLETSYSVLSCDADYTTIFLTLLNYKNEDIIICEYNPKRFGDIKLLNNIVKPTITTITNINVYGSLKNKIKTFREYTSITKNSKVFLKNNDDKLINKIKFKKRVIDYGIEENNVFNIINNTKTRYTLVVNDRRYKININSDLLYLINYSLCALKIGLYLNVDLKNIIHGISNFKTPNGVMEKIKIGKYFIIDDSHNLAYESVIDGLEHFYKSKNLNKVVVLGDINEFKNSSIKAHKNIGKFINSKNLRFNKIYLIGPKMHSIYSYLFKKNFNVYYFKNIREFDSEVLRNKSVYLKLINADKIKKELTEN